MRKICTLFLFLGSSYLSALEFNSSNDLVQELSDKLCKDAATTIAMNECNAEVLNYVDSELNRVYQVIMTDLKNDKNADEISALKSAQRAWVDFRDKDSSLIYQHWITGSIRTMNSINRKIDLTLERIYDLKSLYLHLFYIHLKAVDISGRWVDVTNPHFTLEFKSENNKNAYKCQLKELNQEGSFTVDAGFIEFAGKNCEIGSSQRAYLTAFPKSGPDQSIELQFLADGGGTNYRFRRVILK